MTTTQEQIEKEQKQRNNNRYLKWARKYYHLTHHLPVKNPVYPV